MTLHFVLRDADGDIRVMDVLWRMRCARLISDAEWHLIVARVEADDWCMVPFMAVSSSG